jgi:hypothetical protein
MIDETGRGRGREAATGDVRDPQDTVVHAHPGAKAR